MFNSIKEFFVGKPKVEEKPVETPVPPGTETTIVAPVPVVEEIKPEAVVISISDNMNVSVGSQSDTITLTPPIEPGAWPFPNTPPAEKVTKKKPAPAMTATKTKPRKKK